MAEYIDMTRLVCVDMTECIDMACVCVDMSWLVCVDMAGVCVDMLWLACVDMAGVRVCVGMSCYSWYVLTWLVCVLTCHGWYVLTWLVCVC